MNGSAPMPFEPNQTGITIYGHQGGNGGDGGGTGGNGGAGEGNQIQIHLAGCGIIFNVHHRGRDRDLDFVWNMHQNSNRYSAPQAIGAVDPGGARVFTCREDGEGECERSFVVDRRRRRMFPFFSYIMLHDPTASCPPPPPHALLDLLTLCATTTLIPRASLAVVSAASVHPFPLYLSGDDNPLSDLRSILPRDDQGFRGVEGTTGTQARSLIKNWCALLLLQAHNFQSLARRCLGRRIDRDEATDIVHIGVLQNGEEKMGTLVKDVRQFSQSRVRTAELHLSRGILTDPDPDSNRSVKHRVCSILCPDLTSRALRTGANVAQSRADPAPDSFRVPQWRQDKTRKVPVECIYGKRPFLRPQYYLVTLSSGCTTCSNPLWILATPFSFRSLSIFLDLLLLKGTWGLRPGLILGSVDGLVVLAEDT
ncbi:hypothetical protein C8R44DRAFT_745988 [Mycena epipterygia]|nr:hypothetical protein C8R44DRAFT_745988 [Mycena epipterygia]